MASKKKSVSDKFACSFCGKSQSIVKKLVAGPGVYICDECIELCNEIVLEEGDLNRFDRDFLLFLPHLVNQCSTWVNDVHEKG